MIKIAVCDDEKLHRDYTKKLTEKALSGYPAVIDTFNGAQELMSAINEDGYLPQIAILDIKMKETDGITLAKELNQTAPDCRIIFLTGFFSYATDVYETEHIYFILKSEIKRRLSAALNKALSAVLSSNETIPSITVKSGSLTFVIRLNDIVFMERTGRKTRIVTQEKEITTSGAPQTLLNETSVKGFIRSHQSYWVNCDKVATMENDTFTLTDGSRIPISRTYRQKAKEAFFENLRAEK